MLEYIINLVPWKLIVDKSVGVAATTLKYQYSLVLDLLASNCPTQSFMMDSEILLTYKELSFFVSTHRLDQLDPPQIDYGFQVAVRL